MKKLYASILSIIIWLNIFGYSLADDWTLINILAEGTNVWQQTANQVIKDNWIRSWTDNGGLITNTILFIAITYIVPILVIIGVIVAIVGLWWVMTSTDTKSTQKWISYILWWVGWIVIMFASVFIASNVANALSPTNAWDGWTITNTIINSFSKVIYPFVKLLFYIIPWILFLILLANAFQYVTAQNDDAVKKSSATIVWSVVGIIVILWASFMVNSIYWKWGSQPLTNANLSFVYKVLNWILSFIFLAMVIILIFQAYLIIAKPDDSSRYDKIKKSMLYMFLGIVLIGWAYLLVNFAIIKPNPSI